MNTLIKITNPPKAKPGTRSNARVWIVQGPVKTLAVRGYSSGNGTFDVHATVVIQRRGRDFGHAETGAPVASFKSLADALAHASLLAAA